MKGQRAFDFCPPLECPRAGLAIRIFQAFPTTTIEEYGGMRQVVIDNPIINSPFSEPTRHFRFSDEGITDTVDDGRRISSYFLPIARPKK